ncbi:unnamed protein product [Rangifer tarandus platyrhynchus]|uniref:Uncharacterized protein n=1 Tax=Rangifer tarandus platyrhynchus TaxID=3082113 RepID=A0ABN8YVT9_RANTA|nr:unnamed protein product [Rangifer tarandus platyrhynchus]
MHILAEVLKSLCVRLDWEGGASTEVDGQTRKHTELKTSSWAGSTKELGKGSSGSLSGPGARDGDSSSVLPAEAPLMTSGCSFLHASALWSSEIWSWRPHLFCSPF